MSKATALKQQSDIDQTIEAKVDTAIKNTEDFINSCKLK